MINSSRNMVNTIIRRGEQSQTNNNGGASSAQGYYNIIAANNAVLDVTLRFNYLNAELNDPDKNGLVIWEKQSAQK